MPRKAKPEKQEKKRIEEEQEPETEELDQETDLKGEEETQKEDEEATDASKSEEEERQGTEESGAEEIEDEESEKGENGQEQKESQELNNNLQGSTGKKIALRFLENDEGKAFIGRKKSVFKKYGDEASLYLGKVANEQEVNDKDILLDGLTPHVVFICGSRGSGKSYGIGVIAEELALKNKNVGLIVIDPIGVFWSMKYPNKEEKEVKALGEWGLMPQGLDNLKVFIPEGIKKEVPKETYDATFSIQPSLLTSEDWALTFGIERFSPSGLLLDKVITKVEKGFKTKDGNYIKAKQKNYAIDDLIYCLEKDEEINSREKGFKQDSVRALVSRLEAAKSWGVFDKEGTPLTELSREGQLTIVDTSFLDDNVTALVIGLLARRILAARKINTRKEAAKRMKTSDIDNILELEIPPTWLFIDEAHTLIPSGNLRTPASEAIVEYVKQGRRPGCSLVFATQQPSAIDSRVLSQLDILIAHKLVFDDDIKAVFKRIPSLTPKQYKKPNFIKTLPIGVGLTADRAEETSRAFVMRIRPRMSQHEGREAETVEMESNLTEEEVSKLMKELVMSKLEKERILTLKNVSRVVDTLNAKYRAKTKLSDILDYLEEKGVILTAEKVALTRADLEAEKEEEELIKEKTTEGEKPEGEAKDKANENEEKAKDLGETFALPVKLLEDKAVKIISSKSKAKLFGLLGKREKLVGLKLKYLPIYSINYEYYEDKGKFRSGSCFVNPITTEFIHFKDNRFVESKGLRIMNSLSTDEIKLLQEFEKKNSNELTNLQKATAFSTAKLKNVLKKLEEKKLIQENIDKKKKKTRYVLKTKLDMPKPMHRLLDSVDKAEKQRVKLERDSVVNVKNEKEVSKLIEMIWPNSKVKNLSYIYLPVWEGTLQESLTKEKKIYVNAVDGSVIQN